MTTEHKPSHPTYPDGSLVEIGDIAHSAASGKEGMVVEIGVAYVTVQDGAGICCQIGNSRIAYGRRPIAPITKKVTLTEFQWKLLRDLVGSNFLVAQIDALDNAEVVQ